MIIHLKWKDDTREAWLNGKKLDPKKSQEVYNHSPDGFNVGYSGSGPAQLALAICLELFPYSRQINYQEFKAKVIAGLPREDFEKDLYVRESIFGIGAHGGEGKWPE